MSWIYELSFPVAGLILSVLFIGFSWVGTVFVGPPIQRFLAARGGTNELVGTCISTFGVIYGILAGLTAVAAYESWSRALLIMTTEGNALASLYVDAEGYPDDMRDAVRRAVYELVEHSIDPEWDQVRTGEEPPSAQPYVNRLRDQLYAYEPETVRDEVLHTQAITAFNEYLTHRRLRLFTASIGMPASLWTVLLVGTLLNVIFLWLFDTKMVAKIVVGGILSFFLAILILLVARLDKPMRTNDGMGPRALIALERAIEAQWTGPSPNQTE